MKMLYILNFAKRVNNFSYTSMLAAQEIGIEYHIAGNWGYTSDEERFADEIKYGIHIHQIDFVRAPYDLRNYNAYKQLNALIKAEKFDAIHCNTPIGGVLGRLSGKKCMITAVVYQAHGFHFYAGAPLINWLLYYPVERWLAHYTDALITINKEDFTCAKKLHLRNNGNVYNIAGVGINVNQFHNERNKAIKAELGLPDDSILIVSVGELNSNKNNRFIIEALAKIENQKCHYALCGVGELEVELKHLAESLKVSNNVHFLGYRTDIKDIFAGSDIYVLPSLREGLSRSMMEAMASGLPCVASKIRGNVDLIQDGIGGYLCNPTDAGAFAKAIGLLEENEQLRKEQGQYNLEKIKEYSTTVVTDELKVIYHDAFSSIKAKKGKTER